MNTRTDNGETGSLRPVVEWSEVRAMSAAVEALEVELPQAVWVDVLTRWQAVVRAMELRADQ